MKKTNGLVTGVLGAVGLGCLLAFVGHPAAAAKKATSNAAGPSLWSRAFAPSERRLAQGDLDGAIASLRPVQASPHRLWAGEATQKIAEILQRQGKLRDAYEEYARLVSLTRGSNYASSKVSEGAVHARMAGIALDLGDGARFDEVVRDLTLQSQGMAKEIGDEAIRRRNGAPAGHGEAAEKRFTAQTQEFREALRSPALVLMARALHHDGDIVHRDRLYDLALGNHRSPGLLKEYGDCLVATHQLRAALRIFSQIPKPYPKADELAIRETLRILPMMVAHMPKKDERQEESEAVRKLARLRGQVWHGPRLVTRT